MAYFIYNDGTQDVKVEKHPSESEEHWLGTLDQYLNLQGKGRARLVDTDDPHVREASQAIEGSSWAEGAKLKDQTDRSTALNQPPMPPGNPPTPYAPSPETQAEVSRAKGLEGASAMMGNIVQTGTDVGNALVNPYSLGKGVVQAAKMSEKPNGSAVAPPNNGQNKQEKVGDKIDMSGVMQPKPDAGTSGARGEGQPDAGAAIVKGIADTNMSNQAILLQQQNDLATEAKMRAAANAAALLDHEQKMKLERTIFSKVDQQQAAYDKASEEALALSKETVDPNRFWASRTDGQRAASILAAAFMGFGGHGQDYMSQMNALVSRDIAMQENDLDRRSKGLAKYQNDRVNMIDMFEKQGLNRLGAIQAATQFRWEQLDRDLKVMSLNTQSMEKSEGVKQLGFGLAAQVDNAKQKRAKGMLENANLAAQIELNRSRAAKESAGGPGATVTKPEEHLNNLENGLAQVRELRKHFNENLTGVGNGVSGLVDKTAQGLFDNEASRWNSAIPSIVQDTEMNLNTRVTGYGTVLRTKGFPTAGERKGIANAKFDALEREYSDKIKALKKGGMSAPVTQNQNTQPASPVYPGDVGATSYNYGSLGD